MKEAIQAAAKILATIEVEKIEVDERTKHYEVDSEEVDLKLYYDINKMTWTTGKRSAQVGAMISSLLWEIQKIENEGTNSGRRPIKSYEE